MTELSEMVMNEKIVIEALLPAPSGGPPAGDQLPGSSQLPPRELIQE